MMQPLLEDLADISNTEYQKEITELKSDDSAETLFKIKAALA